MVTVTIIGLNVLVFLAQMAGGPANFEHVVQQYGAVPREILAGRDYPPSVGFPVYLTLVTSMFMHANWMHLGGNMLYMWVFADNLEDRMGVGRFITFYLACGVLAGLSQVIVSNLSSMPEALNIPSIGASGAIAGVMGGYLVLFPRARVVSLFGWMGLVELPALVVLGMWILTQLLSGAVSFGGQALGGVAYAAHVGGFLAGVVLVRVFDRGAQRGYSGDDR